MTSCDEKIAEGSLKPLNPLQPHAWLLLSDDREDAGYSAKNLSCVSGARQQWDNITRDITLRFLLW